MPHIGVGKMEADKLVPGDRVREAITEVEVVKVKVVKIVVKYTSTKITVTVRPVIVDNPESSVSGQPKPLISYGIVWQENVSF